MAPTEEHLCLNGLNQTVFKVSSLMAHLKSDVPSKLNHPGCHTCSQTDGSSVWYARVHNTAQNQVF